MKTLKLTFAQAATLIRTCGDTNTILLRGQPGIGKSALLQHIAKELPDYLPCYIDCAILDLGDIAMPVVDKETMTTRYAPNARFGVGNNQNKPVLLMLDELGKASRPVGNMLWPVALEKRLGDKYLPRGSIVFATTNLDTDGVGDNIPAHGHNRMTVCNLDNFTSEEWIMWGAENGICDEVLNVAREYPQMFECYTDTDTTDNPYIFNPLKGNTKAYVTPRSLEKASNLIKRRDVLGEALLPALAGTVGESAARDIEAMVLLGDSLPKIASVLSSPTTVKLPVGACAHFLMAFRLAGRANAENLPAILTYIKRWDAFEATMLFVTTLAGNKAKVGMACGNREFTAMCAKAGMYF